MPAWYWVNERADWHGIDLENSRGAMTINGEPEGEGYGRDVLGHPLDALAWLANTLAGRGKELKAGMLVMTGSIVSTKFLNPGDEAVIHIRGPGRHPTERWVGLQIQPAASVIGSKRTRPGMRSKSWSALTMPSRLCSNTTAAWIASRALRFCVSDIKRIATLISAAAMGMMFGASEI